MATDPTLPPPGSTPPTPPVGPAPTGTGATPTGSYPSPSSDKSTEAMYGFFQKIMGPDATADQIKKAINNMLNSMIDQMKQEQKRAMEAIKKLRKAEEGDDDS